MPQECIEITSHTFASQRFHTTHFVPSYKAWLDRHDQHGVYGFHRRFLQHLQWRCPTGRWVLKAPIHLFALDALFDSYPDACVVQTHRDPLKVMASQASLITLLRSAFSDRVDPGRIGAELTRRWAEGAERAISARRDWAIGDGRFLDVQYADLARDPLATVRRIYAHFGFDLSLEAERRMRRFLAENPKNKHGRHDYSLARFGLDAREVGRRFRVYCEVFGVPSESAPA